MHALRIDDCRSFRGVEFVFISHATYHVLSSPEKKATNKLKIFVFFITHTKGKSCGKIQMEWRCLDLSGYIYLWVSIHPYIARIDVIFVCLLDSCVQLQFNIMRTIHYTGNNNNDDSSSTQSQCCSLCYVRLSWKCCGHVSHACVCIVASICAWITFWLKRTVAYTQPHAQHNSTTTTHAHRCSRLPCSTAICLCAFAVQFIVRVPLIIHMCVCVSVCVRATVSLCVCVCYEQFSICINFIVFICFGSNRSSASWLIRLSDE